MERREHTFPFCADNPEQPERVPILFDLRDGFSLSRSYTISTGSDHHISSFAYVLLADYAVGFMSTKLWGNINVGLVLGLLQFVSTFGITGWYVHYSNRKLDPIATEIRNEIEGHEFDKGSTVRGAAK